MGANRYDTGKRRKKWQHTGGWADLRRKPGSLISEKCEFADRYFGPVAGCAYCAEYNRLALAKSSYDNIVDKENFSQLHDMFDSQASVNELNSYVNSYSYNR